MTLTVKRKIHFKPGRRSRKTLCEGAVPHPQPSGKIPRVSRLMALAIRFDQLIRLAWQRLIPITLGLFVLTTGLVYFGQERSLPLALSGNIFMLVLMLVACGTARREVTGRQENLPPIGVR